MIWGSFQAITNIHEKQRKQLWSLPCRVLLRCDLLLSAESKSASPHLPPMGTTAVSSPTVGLYVEASFMLHSYLAPVLGGLKLGGHNKATVLNIASQAAPTPSQLGRTVYWAIPLCRTLCLEHDEPHCTDSSRHPWNVGLLHPVLRTKKLRLKETCWLTQLPVLDLALSRLTVLNPCSVILDKVMWTWTWLRATYMPILCLHFFVF